MIYKSRNVFLKTETSTAYGQQMALSYNQFVEGLKSANIKGRRLTVTPRSFNSTRLIFNFYNVPSDVSVSGADAENNRIMFIVSGFDLDSNIPAKRLGIKLAVSFLPREKGFRGRTTNAESALKSIQLFLEQVAAENEPKIWNPKI